MPKIKRFNIAAERLKLVLPDLKAVQENLALTCQYVDEVKISVTIAQIEKAIIELES